MRATGLFGNISIFNSIETVATFKMGEKEIPQVFGLGFGF